MQQHITVEQLQELTEEQRGELRVWWNPTLGDLFVKIMDVADLVDVIHKTRFDMNTLWLEGIEDIGFSQSWNKNQCLPLLSIVQCIELLIDSGYFEDNYTYCDDVLGLVHCDGPGVDFAIGWRDSTKDVEFTDALWQAVKKAL